MEEFVSRGFGGRRCRAPPPPSVSPRLTLAVGSCACSSTTCSLLHHDAVRTWKSTMAGKGSVDVRESYRATTLTAAKRQGTAIPPPAWCHRWRQTVTSSAPPHSHLLKAGLRKDHRLLVIALRLLDLGFLRLLAPALPALATPGHHPHAADRRGLPWSSSNPLRLLQPQALLSTSSRRKSSYTGGRRPDESLQHRGAAANSCRRRQKTLCGRKQRQRTHPRRAHLEVCLLPAAGAVAREGGRQMPGGGHNTICCAPFSFPTREPRGPTDVERAMIRARAATFFDDDDADGAPAPTWIMGVPYTGTYVSARSNTRTRYRSYSSASTDYAVCTCLGVHRLYCITLCSLPPQFSIC